MNEVNESQLISCLKDVGLAEGDGVLVHSAIQFLGRPENGPATYLSAIRQLIGPEGTVAVPAFNFIFAREGRYDPQNSPADGMERRTSMSTDRPNIVFAARASASPPLLGWGALLFAAG